jgi:methionyl-tRNA formyltransferase
LLHFFNHLSRTGVIEVKEVLDINASSFVEELAVNNVKGGISIRCYQMFKSDIIAHFNDNKGGFLWNLHPGIFPQYRGVMTLIRAMNNGEKQTSYSL